MKKQWEFGLVVTNPVTGDKGLVVGFKSRKQAIALGNFRKMRGAVKKPHIVDYNEKDFHKYKAGHFIITQKQIKQEVLIYFDI